MKELRQGQSPAGLEAGGQVALGATHEANAGLTGSAAGPEGFRRAGMVDESNLAERGEMI